MGGTGDGHKPSSPKPKKTNAAREQWWKRRSLLGARGAGGFRAQQMFVISRFPSSYSFVLAPASFFRALSPRPRVSKDDPIHRTRKREKCPQVGAKRNGRSDISVLWAKPREEQAARKTRKSELARSLRRALLCIRDGAARDVATPPAAEKPANNPTKGRTYKLPSCGRGRGGPRDGPLLFVSGRAEAFSVQESEHAKSKATTHAVEEPAELPSKGHTYKPPSCGGEGGKRERGLLRIYWGRARGVSQVGTRNSDPPRRWWMRRPPLSPLSKKYISRKRTKEAREGAPPHAAEEPTHVPKRGRTCNRPVCGRGKG